jgi:hypothetical protein
MGPGLKGEVGMGSSRKAKGGVGSSLAILLVGLLMGSVMLSPVGAHIKNFNHLKTKHFYTKKAANAEFVNIGEAAPNATNAANADKLDTLDSTAFQQKCKDGSVLAYARVEGSATFSSTFTADPAVINPAYNCTGGNVQVKREFPGAYEVLLPGISDNAANTGEWVVVASAEGICWFGCADVLAMVFPTTEGGQDTFQINLADEQDATDANNGQPVDRTFSFTLYDFA